MRKFFAAMVMVLAITAAGAVLSHAGVSAESGAAIELSSRAGETTAPDAVSSATEKPDKEGKHIGADKAKDIALSHAGVKESETRSLKIELDREHGRTVYEVEFKVGYLEYDYEIDAVTGEIVRWHKEYDD